MNATEPADPRPHVVILGGGFAGLYAARSLARAPVRVTVLDRRNHHLFQPLLYQVATAVLNPSDIARPIRRILRRQANATVLLGEAVSIDTAGRRVVLADGGEVRYDHLVVATGATHSYFGQDAWAAFAPGLKTIEDALEIRRRVLCAFEAAERETDPACRRAWLTLVVVGGGPTGVELAGAFAEVARHVKRDFRRIAAEPVRVLLVEGVDRILTAYPPDLSATAKQALERLGVEVKLGARVTAMDAESVTVGDEKIAARTKVWAAGVAASPLARTLGVPLDRAGRVKVERDLTIPGHPEVFVIGDLAALEREDGRGLVPGVAPAAMQEGRHTALNIARALRGEAREPFRYLDKGNLATIGRAAAVADFGKVKLSGFVAWMAWLVVHIAYLIGFRNRLLVLVNWAWAYVAYERGARLITGDPREVIGSLGSDRSS